MIVCGMIAVASLGVAYQAARHAHAESTRGPTAAERDAAARTALDQRWERLPPGQIFPATIAYRSDLKTRETAQRLGIGPAVGCGQALDITLQGAARATGCVGVLRATYADALRGTVYTVGVLAFPGNAAARQFAAAVPQDKLPATGLRALALPGTAAGLFTDQARQSAASQVTGPYVVFVVAGYADGRPASSAAEPRGSAFLPTVQIMTAVVAPLAVPQRVLCGTAEFTC
jgi:hypothetical protein